MNGPIVAGTDGSETAVVAVGRALDLAKAFGQVVHVVSAYRSAAVAAAGLPAEFGPVTSTDRVESALADACARARACGVEAVPHAVEGDPAEAILDVAEKVGADLIVVGNKGIGSVKRFLLGNVPSKVVHNAPCSTHIVHTT